MWEKSQTRKYDDSPIFEEGLDCLEVEPRFESIQFLRRGVRVEEAAISGLAIGFEGFIALDSERQNCCAIVLMLSAVGGLSIE